MLSDKYGNTSLFATLSGASKNKLFKQY